MYVALGLSKIYEREKRHELCSLAGIHRLARATEIKAPSAAGAFTRQYGVQPSVDWATDIEQVFAKQRGVLRKHLKVVDRVRNTQIAHLQQDRPTGDLPSISAYEALLAFAVAFHAFVNDGFFSTNSHRILADGRISGSLATILKGIGVVDAVRDFEDI